MERNILYRKLDMLSVMEACEDKSKDFILLFMPSNMGGTVGPDALGEQGSFAEGCGGEKKERAKLRRIYIDYADATFINRESYISYIKLLAKIIQNAKRILSDEGHFCFAVPNVIKWKNGDREETPNIPLLVKQVFECVKCADIPAYSPCVNLFNIKEEEQGHYTLYICGNGKSDIVYNDRYSYDKGSDYFENDYRDLKGIGNSQDETHEIWHCISTEFSNKVANKLFIKELRDVGFVRKVMLGQIYAGQEDAITYETPQNIMYLACDSMMEEKIKARKEFLQETLREILENPDNDIYLADILMGLYCNSNSKVLFPYDRNGHLAWLAQRRGLNWTSLYKVSLRLEECKARYESPDAFDEKGNCKIRNVIQEDETSDKHNDFLKVPPLLNENADGGKFIYEVVTVPPKHNPIQYDENFLLSATDANMLKDKFGKYSSLLNQVVECVSQNLDDDDPNMEQAVHAIIKLAVKGQKGTICGDEAKNWYGDGWDKLSKRCQDYLQTAYAFEKMSQMNETADFAPIVIEYCRAVELEMNSAVMKPYMDSIKPEKAKKKHGNDSADYFQKIIDKYSDEPQTATMMLGEIGMSLRDAAKCGPDDIHQTLKEYCIKGGKKHLLDSDNVGKYVLISKIRNQSAHPSSLDKGCVDQIRNLVRQGLKAQQSVDDKQPIKDEPLVCAIIGPDGNKLAQSQNTEAFRAAIRNQISVLDQSRIQQFASAGNTGFDLIVSEILMDYKKGNKKHRYVRLTEYLPCNRGTMKFPTGCRERALQVDKDAKVIVSGSIDNAATREACQRKALEKAQFCIAYYKPGGGSKIEEMVNEAVRERGLIVWNAYGIV